MSNGYAKRTIVTSIYVAFSSLSSLAKGDEKRGVSRELFFQTKSNSNNKKRSSIEKRKCNSNHID
jgi:hypothetical protein